MEFRKIFDTIPEKFDKFRLRYSKELFDALIEYAKIGKDKSVLEIGPGTVLQGLIKRINPEAVIIETGIAA